MERADAGAGPWERRRLRLLSKRNRGQRIARHWRIEGIGPALKGLSSATFGHSCLKKLASPMTGLKCTADVARRRTRNEKIYYAGARRSVIIAAQNTDRRAAVSEIELALSTHSSRAPDRDRTFNHGQFETFGDRMESAPIRRRVGGYSPLILASRAIFAKRWRSVCTVRANSSAVGLTPSTPSASKRAITSFCETMTVTSSRNF
jgi:hypothetical protein